MRLRKSTAIWLGVFAAAIAGRVVLDRLQDDGGCVGLLLFGLAVAAGLVLLWRGTVLLFRVIVRKTAMRMAFSYFLIGILPIPLLAALLFLVSYILAHQYMANRMRREITAVGEAAAARSGPPQVRIGADGRVAASDVTWLRPGDEASWLEGLPRPGFVLGPDSLWLAAPVPGVARTAKFLELSDPKAAWVQELADRTGYQVTVELGEAKAENQGFNITTGEEARGPGVTGPVPVSPPRRPAAAPPGKGITGAEWVHAYYLETVLNSVEERAETGQNVGVLAGKTSPRVLGDQLFTQGVTGIANVFLISLGVVGGMLLAVYLAALGVAFVLAGSIARNVNRLTRAADAIARGDFSFRIRSKSRDQIGDLTRSFDGMAESIQRLLVDTAHKERLQGEIAAARTIQQKLLPPAEASLPGFSVIAHFEPSAEIGGDYYDYVPTPRGETAVALGDVSGHGLPTGLLVAMAKAAISTLIEAGHQGGDLFARLNELIHRSTDPRHYMTLVLLAYDPATRRGTLTNAGQLAPYRVSAGRLESIALPSFPLGLFPEREFPSVTVGFEPGDLVVFFTDGLVEAVGDGDEAFGFERFEAVVLERSPHGAAAVRDGLLEAVRLHTGGRSADDDRTLVVLTIE